MEKVYGATRRNDQLLLFDTGNATLIYGYGEEKGNGYDYREFFDHHPEKDEVMEVITNHVNKLTDESILTGFQWQDKPVYLSSENEFNFKAAYDLAVQMEGEALPVKFKLGEQADGTPVYHTFTDLAEFTDFYTSAIAYVNQTLNAGWEEKDNAREWVDEIFRKEVEP